MKTDTKLARLSSSEFWGLCSIACEGLDSTTGRVLTDRELGRIEGQARQKLAGLIGHATIQDVSVEMEPDYENDWVNVTCKTSAGNSMSWTSDFGEIGIDVAETEAGDGTLQLGLEDIIDEPE